MDILQLADHPIQQIVISIGGHKQYKYLSVSLYNELVKNFGRIYTYFLIFDYHHALGFLSRDGLLNGSEGVFIE